jgi:hypothetical protein
MYPLTRKYVFNADMTLDCAGHHMPFGQSRNVKTYNSLTDLVSVLSVY